MGKAKTVGEQYNKIFVPIIEWPVLSLITIMSILGLVIQLFIIRNSDFYPVPYVIIATVLGCLVLYGLLKFDYTMLAKKAHTFYALLTILVLVLFIFNKSAITNKQFYSFFVMLLYPVLFASIVFNKKSKGYKGLLSSWLYLLMPFFMCINSMHMTCAFIMLFSFVFLQVYANNINWFSIKKFKGFLITLGLFLLLLMTAIVVYINMQSSILISSNFVNKDVISLLKEAKIFGKSSLFINSFIPNFRYSTDFCLLFLIMRYGWLIFIAISLLIIKFIVKGFRTCIKQQSMFGKFLGFTILIIYVMQVFSYYLYNLGLQIMNPLTLPFISYGNLAILINMSLMGILMSVFRSGHVVSI
ncbi:FtsW/RodA/SpoVE family cell cycle protein [Clostridium sp. 'deep sea']|uniref:FtsW/RodA/SpoVE family cell cycle protein n=1 Tax=Clostridium sp. 'deep sea' TaxID=2779445 RepID=UPI0018969E51|nr:FtsW/RodA/SpoVE family cell cycle protein [Clostridium sp. 'deep sea']QOR35089.1 FtsW/RodA/SpoVE family cell cycle protein [Clostridium sp. 'deep sea']